jgi:hypothetical protein
MRKGLNAELHEEIMALLLNADGSDANTTETAIAAVAKFAIGCGAHPDELAGAMKTAGEDIQDEIG